MLRRKTWRRASSEMLASTNMRVKRLREQTNSFASLRGHFRNSRRALRNSAKSKDAPQQGAFRFSRYAPRRQKPARKNPHCE
jgi:hypothetical protein